METLLYDDIIGTLLMNVLSEDQRCGDIVLKDFHAERFSHKLYFEAAIIANAICHSPIYLNMPLIEYLKFKYSKRNKKMHKSIHRYNTLVAGTLKAAPTQLSLILDHVADYYKIDNEVYTKIYKEYYEVKNENNNN